ncbi:MAG: hypothetical protein Q7R39_15905, partial [Dehalococcoidia bacterium]|nr:hypothetical protein [Dehalococcoidia bacterium]
LCVDACPYRAVFMDGEDVAHKCDLCASRLDQSLEPFCAICCPTRAISVARSKPAERGRAPAPQLGAEPALRYLTRDEARWHRVSNELVP